MWRADLDVELCVVIPGLYLEHIKFFINPEFKNPTSSIQTFSFMFYNFSILLPHETTLRIKRSLESTSSSKWNMRVFISFRFSSYHVNVTLIREESCTWCCFTPFAIIACCPNKSIRCYALSRNTFGASMSICFPVTYLLM